METTTNAPVAATANGEKPDENPNLVTASKEINGEKKEASVEWEAGTDLDDAVGRYGSQIVFDLYKRAAVIKLQAQMRQRLEAGETAESIATEFANWRPDEDRKPSRDPKKQILSGFTKLTAEEREQLLAQLQGMGADEVVEDDDVPGEPVDGEEEDEG